MPKLAAFLALLFAAGPHATATVAGRVVTVRATGFSVASTCPKTLRIFWAHPGSQVHHSVASPVVQRPAGSFVFRWRAPASLHGHLQLIVIQNCPLAQVNKADAVFLAVTLP